MSGEQRGPPPSPYVSEKSASCPRGSAARRRPRGTATTEVFIGREMVEGLYNRLGSGCVVFLLWEVYGSTSKSAYSLISLNIFHCYSIR